MPANEFLAPCARQLSSFWQTKISPAGCGSCLARLNKFVQFMPQGPLPTGAAGQFLGALFSTHYIMVVGAFEAVGGLLLLLNRYVPLGLCLLAPVIVNILLVGTLLTHAALPSGIVVAILWILVYLRVRPAFLGIYQMRVAS
jgi:putative oxidoreductase